MELRVIRYVDLAAAPAPCFLIGSTFFAQLATVTWKSIESWLASVRLRGRPRACTDSHDCELISRRRRTDHAAPETPRPPFVRTPPGFAPQLADPKSSTRWRGRECTEARSPWAQARRPGSSAPRASSPSPRSTRMNRWRTRGTTPTSPPTTSGSSPPRRRRPPGFRRWTRERAGSRCNPSAASTTSCRARITSTNPRSTPTSSPRTP